MKPAYINWLRNTGETIKTVDGVKVEIWELDHKNDQTVLSGWAKHFRQHYCSDQELPSLVSGTGKSKADFLRDIKFPHASQGMGPSTRSGDFGEILVADYIEYLLGYWCPREHRYENRINANISDAGTDIVGFRFAGKNFSPKDELFVLESKAGLSASNKNRLQDAIDGSAKDRLREAMTLSALKGRLLRKDEQAALRVERFQEEADRPFRRISGAAVVVDDSVMAKMDLQKSDASQHPNKSNLKLIIIKGTSMMDLVHTLYDKAANEA